MIKTSLEMKFSSHQGSIGNLAITIKFCSTQKYKGFVREIQEHVTYYQ